MNQELLNLIKSAIAEDVIIVVITQCHKGTVNDLYETGKTLTKMGVVLGLDMTIECCYTKLAYLLGKVSIQYC